MLCEIPFWVYTDETGGEFLLIISSSSELTKLEIWSECYYSITSSQQHLLSTNQKCSWMCALGHQMLLASTPLLLPPPSLRWLHSCCSGRAAPQGATEWGQGRDLWDTLKVFPCVHRSAYKSHAVFPQYLSVCECVSVCVSRLAKELTLYHVALQEARCPCTGHPRRKPIRKNRDYIWGDWPLIIPFLSLSLKLFRATLVQFHFSFGSIRYTVCASTWYFGTCCWSCPTTKSALRLLS